MAEPAKGKIVRPPTLNKIGQAAESFNFFKSRHILAGPDWVVQVAQFKIAKGRLTRLRE